MTSGLKRVARLRPGWSLGVLALGIAIGVAGAVVRGDAAPSHTFCQLSEELHAFSQALTKQVGPLPAPPVQLLNCGSIDLRYDVGLAGELVGLAIALAGLVWLMRRSRRAARAGASWPVRRAMDAAAVWLDHRLPGRRTGQPRLRGGFLFGFAVFLAWLAVGGIVTLWQSEQRSQQIHTYEVANALLAAAALPAGLKRAPATCGATVCATSTLTPQQVEPTLVRLVHGKPSSLVNALVPCLEPNRCPVDVYGHFHGALAVADASWNEIIVRNGNPPKGAVRAHTLVRPRPGQPVLYWFGCNIYISAIDPRQPT